MQRGANSYNPNPEPSDGAPFGHGGVDAEDGGLRSEAHDRLLVRVRARARVRVRVMGRG